MARLFKFGPALLRSPGLAVCWWIKRFKKFGIDYPAQPRGMPFLVGPGGAAVWAFGLAAFKDAGRAPIGAEHPAPRELPFGGSCYAAGPKKNNLPTLVDA